MNRIAIKRPGKILFLFLAAVLLARIAFAMAGWLLAEPVWRWIVSIS